MCFSTFTVFFFLNHKSRERSYGHYSLDIHTISYSHDNISCGWVSFPIRPLGPCCDWLLLWLSWWCVIWDSWTYLHVHTCRVPYLPAGLDSAVTSAYVWVFSPEGQWQSIIFSEDVKKMWWPVKTDTSTNPFSMLHQELCPFKLKLIFSNITFWSAYLL